MFSTTLNLRFFVQNQCFTLMGRSNLSIQAEGLHIKPYDSTQSVQDKKSQKNACTCHHCLLRHAWCLIRKQPTDRPQTFRRAFSPTPDSDRKHGIVVKCRRCGKRSPPNFGGPTGRKKNGKSTQVSWNRKIKDTTTMLNCLGPRKTWN